MERDERIGKMERVLRKKARQEEVEQPEKKEPTPELSTEDSYFCTICETTFNGRGAAGGHVGAKHRMNLEEALESGVLKGVETPVRGSTPSPNPSTPSVSEQRIIEGVSERVIEALEGRKGGSRWIRWTKRRAITIITGGGLIFILMLYVLSYYLG